MLRGGQVLLNYFVLFLFVLVWFIFFLMLFANMFSSALGLVLRLVGSLPVKTLCRLVSHTCFQT